MASVRQRVRKSRVKRKPTPPRNTELEVINDAHQGQFPLGSAAGIVAVATAHRRPIFDLQGGAGEYVRVCGRRWHHRLDAAGLDTCVKPSGYITAQIEGATSRPSTLRFDRRRGHRRSESSHSSEPAVAAAWRAFPGLDFRTTVSGSARSQRRSR